MMDIQSINWDLEMRQKAIDALIKEYEETYSLEEQKDIAFYVDDESTKYYQWKFKTIDGKIHVWRYKYFDKTIDKSIKSV